MNVKIFYTSILQLAICGILDKAYANDINVICPKKEYNSGNTHIDFDVYCDSGAGSRGLTSTANIQWPTYNKDISVWFDGPPLNRIERFSNNTEVTRLELRNNNISSIDEWAFAGLPNLKILRIYISKLLEVVPKNSLRGLHKLTHLSIDNNRISTISSNDFKDLQSLEILYLHSNRITKIDSGSFSYCPNLNRLYLDNNKLTSLQSTLFLSNKLDYIELYDNPWNCDCVLQQLLQSFEKKSISYSFKEPKCQSPEKLRNTEISNWYETKKSDTSCSYLNLDVEGLQKLLEEKLIEIEKLKNEKYDEKEQLQTVINDLNSKISEKTKNSCEYSSVTTINDGKPTCKDEVIFHETFKDTSLNRSIWIIEQRLPADDFEYEFVSYQKRSVSLEDGKLKITPYLLQRVFPHNRSSVLYGTLDLTNECTASSNIYCKKEAFGRDILPPVVSGKISTQNLFSFKYGKVEIIAKLPIGDWLYPELFLEPLRQLYGTSGYESGQMRVAFARGNRNLQYGTKKLDNSQLSGGIMLGVFGDCRTVEMKSIYHNISAWGEDYHNYTLIWRPAMIEMLVDDISYGKIFPGFRDRYNNNICPSFNTTSLRWSTGSDMAPYDKEFYISIGLGVGGIADFPDGVGGKTWRDKSAKAELDFFEYGETWYDSLKADEKPLFVESIKITAL